MSFSSEDRLCLSRSGIRLRWRGVEFESLFFLVFFATFPLVAHKKHTKNTQVLRLGGKKGVFVFFSKFLSRDKERVLFVSFTFTPIFSSFVLLDLYGTVFPLPLTFSCHFIVIFTFFTFFTTFLWLSRISRRMVLSMCNIFSNTVFDENIDISTQIHVFTSKYEIFNIGIQSNLNES